MAPKYFNRAIFKSFSYNYFKNHSFKIWFTYNMVLCFQIILFVLILYYPFTLFKPCLIIFLGWSSTKQRIKCPAQGHKTVPPMRLELATLWIPSLTLPLLDLYSIIKGLHCNNNVLTMLSSAIKITMIFKAWFSYLFWCITRNVTNTWRMPPKELV